MSTVPVLSVEGIGLWAPQLPGWEAAGPVLRGSAPVPGPQRQPEPVLLPPAERRRCPDSVGLALTVASAACAQARLDPALLPAVFASTYGDLAITDQLCATLAGDPRQLSPTRFHNSVHNAAAGYWTIATGCRQPCTALAAGPATFAAALLAAAAHAHAEATPVLVVAFDTEARGPLREVVPSRGLFGVALVLSPTPSARAGARLGLDLEAGLPAVARPANAALVAGNAMAGCLPLFEALAAAEPRRVRLALDDGTVLAVNCQPGHGQAAA